MIAFETTFGATATYATSFKSYVAKAGTFLILSIPLYSACSAIPCASAATFAPSNVQSQSVAETQSQQASSPKSVSDSQLSSLPNLASRSERVTGSELQSESSQSTLIAQSQPQYGQPARSALDAPQQNGIQYGQPAGSALNQPTFQQQTQQYAQSPAGVPSTNYGQQLNNGPQYNFSQQPNYGQPAGSALDQQMPSPIQNGQPGNLSTQTFPTGSSPSGLNTPNGFGTGEGAQNPNMPPMGGRPNGSRADLCPIDVSTLKLSKLEVDLENAQFMTASVDKLHLVANNLDVQNGSLSGLNIFVKSGQFKDVAFDQLSLATQGDLHFDRDQFLANKTLQFTSPASAQVSAIVSQEALTRFLNSPTTLQRLSATVANKVKFLASMMGSNANIGLTLSDASVSLLKGNHVDISVKAQVGLGKTGVPLPLSLTTKLALNGEGWIALSDTQLKANGQEISPLLSNMVVKHFNEMADWGKLSDDIKFSFSELKVIPNKQFIVKGTAKINRLRFGQ